ncbi:ABC transporter substrate-binding protein [Kineosporia mesophila]|uniref:ABC transporter substrate-binding protein n=1 Tax=Kineosporia mesophila TaxID=566012 RepID=A0ABP7AEE2_9ACTN|nr:ABC transporter substrate-binding protein [Kineosporia mesophila]MCD5352871.1 ABC transporter substrate-binding protein [Kineosporia mesophila]
MGRKERIALIVPLGLTTLVACGSSGSTDTGQDGEPVSGGTYVKAISSDPGDLNPFTNASLAGREMVATAYESLANVTAEGDFVPWLAESWKETGTSITYTLKPGITCSDGTPFTAGTAADNINYNAVTKNATFYFGSQITAGISAKADGNVLTVTSKTNDPFLLSNTGTVAMVCESGLKDPGSLDDKPAGTGLFALSDATAGSEYTFTRRDDYTWGPDGVTSDTVGLPDTYVVRVVTDESTAANLLLSGDLNSAVVLGSDRQRLDAAGLKTVGTRNPVGEILFNERSDRPTSDPKVREALSLALNQEEVASVVTDGSAEKSNGLVVSTPLLCVGSGPRWTLPAQDAARSATLLDEAGWKLGADGKRTKDGKTLTVKFIYDAATATHAAAAELVQQTWDTLGVTTELSPNDAAAWSEQLWQTFDWDTGFVQVAPGSPAVLSNFFGGATPDKGGVNFMFVDNPEYQALTEQATAADPDSTCDLWQQAETKLIENFDAFPLADNLMKTYFTGSELENGNYTTPTAIRMLG